MATIIPMTALVGYEMIKANSALSVVLYPTEAQEEELLNRPSCGLTAVLLTRPFFVGSPQVVDSEMRCK